MFTLIALLTCAFAHAQSPPPIDPQKVQDQDLMTWADYHPIPGVDWADPKLVPSRKQFKVALVAVDFPDQPFVITLLKNSDLFGNPQIDPVPREKAARFYADFYNTPSAVNHGHTINGYWMEQSRGQIGIGRLDAFGPYRMPKNLYQYGLNEYNQQSAAPAASPANGRLEPDADALWAADAGANIKSKYDIVIRIYAGYDETSVWQEFGEMKFQTKEDIPAAWGSPEPGGPRWVTTRYEPWTTWRAGAQQWGLSSVRQGESSGTITHEIVHFAFRVGDNNNNPYEPPFPRAGSGPWDIMDRGSFNGPGGPHRRWVVPAAEGASMPAGLMLRSKIRFQFLREDAVLTLTRSGLASSGLAVGTVVARAVDPPPGQFAGIVVRLDGPAPGDHSPPQNYATNPVSSGDTLYDFYSVEVVERIGYDSFTPDNGVLIAKNLDQEQHGRGFHPFTYVIDAHPEDIRMIDFKRPHGEPVMRTVADYRQLNDALFHAGLNSGSQFEWEDMPNRLHFYIVDLHKDAAGVLSYVVGVRSLDGSGPQARGVSLTPSANCSFNLRNTGDPGSTDIYRLSVSAEGPPGSGAQLLSALAAVRSGESQPVQVYLTGAPTRVTLEARSESDPKQSAASACIANSAAPANAPPRQRAGALPPGPPTRADILRGAYGRYRANNDLLFYHLDVRVDPDRKVISGKNTIRFKMLQDDTRIQLDLFDNLKVDKIVMGRQELHSERELGAVFVDFPETLKKGRTYSIDFHYSGTPRQTSRFGGFTFGQDPAGRPWIYTACEGIGASLWWPNKDQWRDEVEQMRLSVSIPNGLVDVSNGKFLGKTGLGDGYTRWDWLIQYPINNYDVSLNIGKYEHFADKLGDLPLDFYALPEDLEKARTTFAQAKGMIEAYQHYFGEYPFKKDGYKLVEVPYSGMEHQTAVTYGNHFANGYLERDWTGVGISPRFDFIIIHESGHEWFGNAITAADVSDMWIHEGWTTYLECLYVEYRWGKEDGLKYTNGYKSKVRNLQPIITERGINRTPPQDMYFKGALFLNTLRSVVNDDQRWFALLHDLFQHFKYRNILTEEMVAFFNQRTGMNLTPVFDEYLRHAALPVLELKFNDTEGTVAYRWEADEPAFAMPVRVGANGNWQVIQPATEWKTMKTSIPKNDFAVATDLYFVNVSKE